MKLIANGKLVNDEQGNPFAVTMTRDAAVRIQRECNAHEQLVAQNAELLRARQVLGAEKIKWDALRKQLVSALSVLVEQYESLVRDEYEGTSMIEEVLKPACIARAALTAAGAA